MNMSKATWAKVKSMRCSLVQLAALVLGHSSILQESIGKYRMSETHALSL